MSDLPSTILHPHAFQQSPSAGFDGVYHWGFWAPAIAQGVAGGERRGIRPGDVDAIVEINSFFLTAETKDPGIAINHDSHAGDVRTRRALMQVGLFCFIYQWGKEIPTAWQYETPNGRSPVFTVPNPGPTIKDDISAFITRWSAHHDALDEHAWRDAVVRKAFSGAPDELKRRWLDELRQDLFK